MYCMLIMIAVVVINFFNSFETNETRSTYVSVELTDGFHQWIHMRKYAFGGLFAHHQLT